MKNSKYTYKVSSGGVDKTVQAIYATLVSSYNQPRIKRLAQELYSAEYKQAAWNVWNYIRSNIKYVSDPDGVELIRDASRTLDDGKGDCEDMTILGCALFYNMGYIDIVRTNVVAFNNSQNSSHIFATIGNEPNKSNSLVIGISIDCVPPLTKFDELGYGITKNFNPTLTEMEIYVGTTPNINGISGTSIQGIGVIGYAADGITQKLMQYQSELISKHTSVRGIAAIDNAAELRKTHTLIRMNGTDDRDILMPVMEYVQDISANGNIIWKSDAPIDMIAEYLDEAYQAKAQSAIDGIEAVVKKAPSANQKGAPKVPFKTALQNIQQKLAPKKAAVKANPPAAQSKPKLVEKLKKVAHVLTKVNPATIAARNGAYIFLELNLFKVASKLSLGYLTEAEAKTRKLNMNEWNKLRSKIAEIENVFYAIGGEKAKFKQMVLKGAQRKAKRDAKKTGVKGIGMDPATLALLTACLPVLISIVAKVANVDFKGIQTDPNAPGYDAGLLMNTVISASGLQSEISNEDFEAGTSTPQNNGFRDESEMTQAQQAMSTRSDEEKPQTEQPQTPNDGNPNPEQKGEKDNTILYILGGGIALFAIGKATKMF